jgi:IS5 family transposase
LWVFATVQGVGSARQLARLCDEHDAYRWLRGGVPINHHMLSDFRVARGREMDELLSQIVGMLMTAEAVTLEKVAQDGMRVRAGAGAASYRRKDTLEVCLEEARAQVQRLARERERPDPGVTKRQEKARERAARERLERVEKALSYLPQIEESKARQRRQFTKAAGAKVTKARSSTTDPEARVMKMPDGGFRPAYNVQFATDAKHGVIVGVSVTNAGSDAGQATPTVEQIRRRTGLRPRDYLVDGGYAAREDISALAQKGVTVYAPVRLPRNQQEMERYQPRWGDSPEAAEWRQRMATTEAKALYKLRGSLAEWANAQTHQHGLSQFNVRGIARTTAATLLIAVTHNLLRWMSLPR